MLPNNLVTLLITWVIGTTLLHQPWIPLRRRLPQLLEPSILPEVPPAQDLDHNLHALNKLQPRLLLASARLRLLVAQTMAAVRSLYLEMFP